MYDVAIIGCGIVGAAAAYELSRYRLKTVVLEKDADIACGTTKANSAIIHAGYDPEPGTAMAELDVLGAKLTKEIAEKLDVHYKQIGSLVLGFDDEDMQVIKKLYENGVANGVEGVAILDGKQVLEMEPNLNSEVIGALYAPTAAIINPWEMCIAMAETAKINGTEFRLNSPVNAIEKIENGYRITTPSGVVEAAYVVNAAGVYSDAVHNLVGEPEFKILPSKGQYYLLDKSEGEVVNHIIFQCPSKVGKGVLIAPTVHGNLIVGPDASDVEDADDVSTTQDRMDFVREISSKSVPKINFRASIRNFAGIRAISDQPDFIIAESKTAKNFINLAGIKSPGLTSAPAIALRCVEILKGCGLALEKKESFTDERHVVRFKELSMEEKAEIIKKDPRYGRIICRCETITEGEIVAALRSPITPVTVDGIKKRCNAGMGRCQGGFCGPRVQEIISRELNIKMEDIELNTKGSYILTGETKEGGC